MGTKTRIPPVKLLFKSRDEFRAFQSGEDRSFGVIFLLYAILLAALTAVWAASLLPAMMAAPVYIAAFAVIGWAQYSLGNGMHEAVHYNLRNKRGDRLAWLLTAYPVGIANDRDYHMRHHQYVGTQKDPDYGNYSVFPGTKPALIARFFWFVSGIPAVLQFVAQHLRTIATQKRKSYFDPVAVVATQIGLLAVFWWAFGNPLYYIVFWVLPIATIGKLLSTTRLLCEHGNPGGGWVVRTVVASRWQTWLMGAFDFNYHAEHHLFPSVPYAQLRRLHDLHHSYASRHPEYRPYNGKVEFFTGGYLALLAHWFRILPWSQPARAQTSG